MPRISLKGVSEPVGGDTLARSQMLACVNFPVIVKIRFAKAQLCHVVQFGPSGQERISLTGLGNRLIRAK